jgi:hypothetical protein
VRGYKGEGYVNEGRVGKDRTEMMKMMKMGVNEMRRGWGYEEEMIIRESGLG